MTEITEKILLTLSGVTFTSIVAGILYFLKKKDDELNLVRNKISDEKYKTYFDITSLFFDLLKQEKGLAKFDQTDLTNRYIDIKKNLLLLGSDQVLLKYIEFDKYISIEPTKTDVTKFKKYLELFLLIRKDSGNPRTKMTTDDIIRSITASEKDYFDVKALIEKENIN